MINRSNQSCLRAYRSLRGEDGEDGKAGCPLHLIKIGTHLIIPFQSLIQIRKEPPIQTPRYFPNSE